MGHVVPDLLSLFASVCGSPSTNVPIVTQLVTRSASRSTRGLSLPFNDEVQIVPMTATYAAEVVTWRYPAPYDCYDMTDADPAFLASPGSGFFALTDERGLIGFRSFGPDGQVPGGVYDDSALDTGGGLRPDLTGKGKGREAIQTGLDFGRQQFAPVAFRVTIATFNIRAQRVVAALGFRNIGSFRASTDGRSYEMLIKSESAP
jgi:[ribosomal protein S18]-alanine N-acetyltransferase